MRSIAVIGSIAFVGIALCLGCEPAGSSAPSVEPDDDQASPPSKTPAATKAGDGEKRAKKRRSLWRPPPQKNAIPAPADVAEPPDDAEKTESGLAYRVLRKGGGQPAGPYDVVTVHYTGWLTDGVMFDSSVARGETSQFRVNEVIKGWTEGLQLMRRGEKRRLWIPEELAYKGQPRRPPGMLVFDVELIKIDRAPPLPPVPEDVAGPPEDAERTESGLASRVLKKGRGSKRPSPTSKVKVAFTGWETDGKLFRSTKLEGRPAVMPLDRISSKGLSEGLQLMVKGEKRRVWIPAELAYKGRPNAPQGMIVMDIEMLEIMD